MKPVETVRNSYQKNFQILYIKSIWEGQNYQTLQSTLDLWQSKNYCFSFTQLFYFHSFSIYSQKAINVYMLTCSEAVPQRCCDEQVLRKMRNPFIPKLHGKMKQKLALLWSRINAKNRALLCLVTFLLQPIAIRCVVTVDYDHFLCHCNSRIVLLNQNICANELNIVLLCAFRSDKF